MRAFLFHVSKIFKKLHVHSSAELCISNYRTTHSPAGLPSVFAIVVVLTVWVTECQRDEVLSGRRVHPLIGVDGRMS